MVSVPIYVRSREFVEGQLRVLKYLGIDPDKEDIGLKLTTQADALYIKGYEDGEGNYIKGYIDLGIKFFSYNEKRLAGSILAANLAHPDIFVDPANGTVSKRAIKEPVLYVLGAIKDARLQGVWLAVESEKSKKAKPNKDLKDRLRSNAADRATGASL